VIANVFSLIRFSVKTTPSASTYYSGSQTVVRVPLVVRKGFSGGTRTDFLSYWKALLIRFCVIIRSCLMLMLS